MAIQHYLKIGWLVLRYIHICYVYILPLVFFITEIVHALLDFTNRILVCREFLEYVTNTCGSWILMKDAPPSSSRMTIQFTKWYIVHLSWYWHTLHICLFHYYLCCGFRSIAYHATSRTNENMRVFFTKFLQVFDIRHARPYTTRKMHVD